MMVQIEVTLPACRLKLADFRLSLVACLVLTHIFASPSSARALQAGSTRSDTVAARLETLVVTAERSTRSIEQSTQAVAVITRAELLALPARTLADALRLSPGLAFLDFEGSGGDPQLVTRGFYGGGDSEYAMLLVNGRPINALPSGRIAWDLIPVSAIERIEIVRGGNSAVWGDAAQGGVINIVTRSPLSRGETVSITGGDHGYLEGAFDAGGSVRGVPVALFGDLTRSNGFRDHSARTTGAVGVSAELARATTRSIELSTIHDWRDFQSPGPLSEDELSTSRSGASPFYRFDRTRDRFHRVQLEGRWFAGEGAWSAALSTDYWHEDRIRTIPLAATFGDTKDRVTGAARLSGNVQAQWRDIAVAGDELLIGVDVSTGTLSSTYYDIVFGPLNEYEMADGDRGLTHASGSGRRSGGAPFFGYSLQPSSAVRVTLGGRLDHLRDSYDADQPAASTTRATHTAFSPRTGINVRYAESDHHSGHLFANAGRSFKAPTLDQLFDQRRFPVPFPPYEIGFANAELRPQYATNVEIGLYHRASLGPGGLSGEVSFAAYQLDLRDELDFDLETFGFRNIGRSRHRGIEAGLDLRGRGAAVYARYTHQAATHRSGDDSGNQLRAIPRHFMMFGGDLGSDTGFRASVAASRTWGVNLDDANTLELPAWTRWDLRVSRSIRGVTVYAQAMNIFDARYNTTGYPDPAGEGGVYYYPAAGRAIQIGLSHTTQRAPGLRPEPPR